MPLYLTRDADASVLAEYLTRNHAELAPLLPADTVPADLFRRVDRSKDLDVFFAMEKADDKEAAKRALARLEDGIEVLIADEMRLQKEQHKKEKHAAAQRKSQGKKRPKQAEEPPAPPTMTMEENEAVLLLGAEEKKAKARAKLFESGLELRAGVGPECIAEGTEHVQFFWKGPAHACQLMGVELMQASRKWGVIVRLDGPALEKFESIKRAYGFRLALFLPQLLKSVAPLFFLEIPAGVFRIFPRSSETNQVLQIWDIFFVRGPHDGAGR